MNKILREGEIMITEYLNKVYKDFADYLSSGNELCKLKSVNYDTGKFPDYTDINIQQYYLLRYAYGYECEYRAMFQDMLKMFPILKQQGFTTLSIGCGAGLDAMGMFSVLGAFSSSRYIGIDIVDWNYKFEGKNVKYKCGDVLACLSKIKKQKPIDVLCFPKSISEFDKKQIAGIVQNIERINENKYIYLLISLRTSVANRDKDLKRTKLLCQEFEKYGYKKIAGNKSNEWRIFKNKKEPVALEVIKSLNEYCITFDLEGENCLSCDTERLQRWPILKVGEVAYQIFYLEKETK